MDPTLESARGAGHNARHGEGCQRESGPDAGRRGRAWKRQQGTDGIGDVGHFGGTTAGSRPGGAGASSNQRPFIPDAFCLVTGSHSKEGTVRTTIARTLYSPPPAAPFGPPGASVSARVISHSLASRAQCTPVCGPRVARSRTAWSVDLGVSDFRASGPTLATLGGTRPTGSGRTVAAGSSRTAPMAAAIVTAPKRLHWPHTPIAVADSGTGTRQRRCWSRTHGLSRPR